MLDTLKLIFSPDYFFTVIRVMTPIFFAALACMMFYKGGVDAIGTEGIMLICALTGVIGGHYIGNALGGVLTGALTGAFISIIYVFVTQRMEVNEILAGIAVNTLASGLTIFILYLLVGEKGSSQNLPSPTIPNIQIPIINKIPLLGEIVSGHSVLTYVSFILAAVSYFLLYRTKLGLHIRAVGMFPEAAESVGINVMRTKYISSGIAGGLAGLGGVFMSMSYLSNFTKEMVAGRGFIGMAAEGMGMGTPKGVMGASFLFGAVDSLAIRLQGLNLPTRIVQALPYIVTIVVISLYSLSATHSKNRRNKKHD
uniref:ABC transporter permease n=1 Tax=Ndongobacter massiliensis TaxID=1871025 RepID=UPI0009315F72|nr:ABC transporter permease [Ndongobacter massiliensis]